MITFEQVCSQFGLEPKAVREIIKGDYNIKVDSKYLSGTERAEQMEKLINWYMDYLTKPKYDMNKWKQLDELHEKMLMKFYKDFKLNFKSKYCECTNERRIAYSALPGSGPVDKTCCECNKLVRPPVYPPKKIKRMRWDDNWQTKINEIIDHLNREGE